MEIDHGFTTEMNYAIAGSFTGGLSTKGLQLLKSDWYNVAKVFPVTRKHESVEGLKAYYSVKDLPEPIDVLIMVHKPEVGIQILQEVLTLSYKPSIWFMPSTSSPEIIALCEDNDLRHASSCLMGHRECKGITKFFNMHYIHSKLAGMNRIPKQPLRERSVEELVVEE